MRRKCLAIFLSKRHFFWRYSVDLLGGHFGRLDHQVKILVPPPHLPSLLRWAQQCTEICHTFKSNRCIRQMCFYYRTVGLRNSWHPEVKRGYHFNNHGRWDRASVVLRIGNPWWLHSWGNAHECTMHYSSSHATEASCSCCLAAMQFASGWRNRVDCASGRPVVSQYHGLSRQAGQVSRGINQLWINHTDWSALCWSQSWSFLEGSGHFPPRHQLGSQLDKSMARYEFMAQTAKG